MPRTEAKGAHDLQRAPLALDLEPQLSPWAQAGTNAQLCVPDTLKDLS